jgi:outer membrane murein-binding lipoprotein Lpp
MEIQDQLNQMQGMMEQLVKMVGHNNSVTEKLVQRMDKQEAKMDRLETKVDRLEAKIDKLEAKVCRLEAKVDALETRVDILETKMENGFTDVVQMITSLGQKVDKIDAAQNLQSEMLRKLAADYAQHEAEIILLKRAK